MEPITFRCSACNQVLKVSAEKAGRKVKCNKCNAAVTVPAAEAAAPQPAPEPAPAKAKTDDDEGGTYVLKDVIASPPPVEAKKSDEDEDDEEYDEDEDGPRKIELMPKLEGPGRRAAAKQRALLEPEKWQKVQLGIFIVACGIWAMLGAFVLRQVPPILGIFNPPEYAELAKRWQITRNAGDQPVPENIELSRAEFLIALTTGSDSMSIGLILARVAQVLAVLAGITMLVGYIICLPVPRRFGTHGLIISLITLGGINLIFGIVFKLLPYCGIMDYAIIPVAVPECVLVGATIERTVPLNVVHSALPFFDFALAPFILGAYFAEPILFCMFLRAVAQSMKDEVFEEQTKSLVRLALGTVFIHLSYLMCSISGTSEVVVWLLRVLYTLWACFFVGQLIWFALVFMKVPAMIEKEIDVSEIGQGKPFEKEDEDEDEAQEDGEADTEAKAKPRKKKRARDEDEDEEEEDED
jgi:hypothetical protein